MSEDQPLLAGVADLERAEEIARELHAGCCQPLRSPRMEALAATLHRAHEAFMQLESSSGSADQLVELLEDAGGQLGYLQVACCSGARSKLYTEALARLGSVQRLITRAHGLEH